MKRKYPLVAWTCQITGQQTTGDLVGQNSETGKGLCLNSRGWLQRVLMVQIQIITP